MVNSIMFYEVFLLPSHHFKGQYTQSYRGNAANEISFGLLSWCRWDLHSSGMLHSRG